MLQNKKPTRLSLGWVLMFVSSTLSSRFAHPLTPQGPQQQQQPQQQVSIELDKVCAMKILLDRCRRLAPAWKQLRSTTVFPRLRRQQSGVKSRPYA
jgi:hypothetical protein